MSEENSPAMPDKAVTEVDEKEALKDVMNNIYAQQYFDTSAREFTNEVFNASIQQFLNQTPSLRDSLLKVTTAEQSDKSIDTLSSEIDSKLAKLTMDFYALLEKNADALEMYLYHHILTIPSEKILAQDEPQMHYKELVRTLKNDSSLTKEDNAESRAGDILSKKLDEERCELLRKKCEKMRLKLEIELAEKIIKRLESLENSVNSVTSNFDGSLKDFVLKSITALKGLPRLDEVLDK